MDEAEFPRAHDPSYMRTFAHAHAHAHTRTHTHTHTHTQTHSHSCTHTHTHTHHQLLLASVILYAATEVLFKKYGTRKGDPAAVQNSVRFMGYMGIHTLLWQWFPLIALHYSGFETFEWPTLG